MMSKQVKKALVPQLRFPEFKDAGAWEEKQLGNHCSITTGTLNANAMVENGQYRFYTCAKDYYFINEYEFDTDALLISGNGANVGYIHHYKGRFNAYQRTYVLDEFNKNILFIKYYLECNLYKRISIEKKDGNTPYIVMSTLTDMKILVPQDKEQQKIADCLSSLDDLITVHAQKHDALKVHKKGLMQKLFPAEGETTPKLRFPEFKDAGAWEEKPLHQVLDYERPDRYIVTDTNYQQTGIPVLTANKSFILGYTSEEDGVFNNTPVIIFDDFTVDKKYVDFSFKVKSSAIKILTKKGNNNLKFIFELMNQIKLEAIEHKRYYISVYQNLFIRLPKLQEQQTIADCLSSIDDLITVQSQKIESLKTHKKGLMQQLFPSSEEVNI